MEKNDERAQNPTPSLDDLPRLADDELSTAAGGFIFLPVNPVTGQPVFDPA